MTCAPGAGEAKTRREERADAGAIARDEQRRIRPQPPDAFGSGVAGPSALLPLVRNYSDWRSSRRLSIWPRRAPNARYRIFERGYLAVTLGSLGVRRRCRGRSATPIRPGGFLPLPPTDPGCADGRRREWPHRCLVGIALCIASLQLGTKGHIAFRILFNPYRESVPCHWTNPCVNRWPLRPPVKSPLGRSPGRPLQRHSLTVATCQACPQEPFCGLVQVSTISGQVQPDPSSLRSSG